MSLTEAGGTLTTWLETLFAVPAFRRLVRGHATRCTVTGLFASILLFAVVPAMAQAQLPTPPFPHTQSVAWDGEIMDNIVLRYRRVLRYPEAADRAIAALNQHFCLASPTLAESWRQQLAEYEEVVYLSGTSKRTEKRGVTEVSGGACSEPVSMENTHTIDIRTLERRILYTSRGNQRKVSVTEPPPEIVSMLRSRAHARLRDARNPRTTIGRSMGRVWTQRASFNGFDCGSTVFGVEHSCVLLEQPRHVATNTPISVRTKLNEDDPRCEDPASPDWNVWLFHVKCLIIFHTELVAFESNARIPRDLFEMPAEARGLPVSRAGVPDVDEGRERD